MATDYERIISETIEDCSTIQEAVNEVKIVSPRYGDNFKSLPMLAAEVESTITEWQDAVNTIVVNDGVPALAVSTASGENQQDVNDYTGAKWRNKVGGYDLNARVMLESGDIVKSTVANNTVDPNVDMAGWVFDKQLYLASWFADSESESDQSLALRNGYLKAVENGVPFVIDAVFNVDPVAIDAGLINDQNTAFEVVSNSVILFTPDGALKTIPNNKRLSSLMLIANDVENIFIFKPKLIGDRIEHTYVSGTNEWGYGLTIYESKNVTVIEPDCSNFIGDGIYVGKVWGSETSNVPTDIFIDRPRVDRCRRNGIAATAWNNLKIAYPKITNCGVTIDGISGTGPNAGIDIEPEKATSTPIFRNVSGEIVSPYIENCGIGVCAYNKIDDFHFEMTLSGTTTLKDCVRNTSLSNGASGNTGYLHITYMYLDNVSNTVHALWSADGRSRLILDKVRHARASQAMQFSLSGYGAYVNKIVGNFDIYLDNQGVNVAYTIASGTDLGDYTLRNVKLSANTEISHTVDAVNTYAKYPVVNMANVNIEGYTNFSDAAVDLSNYRGLKTIFLSSAVNQNVSFSGMGDGLVRIRTANNSSLKTINGLSLRLKNGLIYDQISTSTPSQEIEISVTTGRDIIKNSTFGWDGLTIRASKTFDCPSIPANSYQSTDITLTGVTGSDVVVASFSQQVAGLVLSAIVSAENTVTVYFQNLSPAPIDPPSGTLRVRLV